jgi:N-acetylglucosamine malate deacetylase 1
MTDQKRVLAIHAHPDDVEFQCAGVLALLKQKGWDVTIMTMTPGDCGSAELATEEIAQIRREEALEAANLLGSDYDCLEFRDLSICFDNQSRGRISC